MEAMRMPRGNFPEVIDWLLLSQHRIEMKVWELTEEVKKIMATVVEAKEAVDELNGKADELIALAKEIKANQPEVDQASVDAIFDGAKAQSSEVDAAMAELRS